MSDVLRELAYAKAVFQLRAIEAVIRGTSDSDGTATAALCEDIAVPQDCQARAESIAQTQSQSID